MSSPIAKANKSGLDQALILTHQKLSHSRRIAVLAEEYACRVKSLGIESPRILDVGCGDLSLARALSVAVSGSRVQCIDIYPPPKDVMDRDPFWLNYKQFDGQNIPFVDGSFDFAIFSDVLHHVPEDLRGRLLLTAGQAAQYVLIKDHFEYGWTSRHMLRAMDFLGNFGYGVSVPKRYFDRSSFAALLGTAGMTVEKLDIGVRLYDHLPLLPLLLSPDWQFIALCRRQHP
jgi:SAM-dependent methyltransferase